MKKALALIIALAGCQFVPDSAAELRDVNPLDVAPDQMAAGIALPPGLALAPRGASIVVVAERSDTGAALDQRFVLADGEQDNLRRLSIAAEDHARYAEMQATIRDWKQEAPASTHGSMTVAVTLCELANGPERGDTVSVWFEAGPDIPFQPVLEDVPVWRLKIMGAVLAVSDPVCAR